MKLIEYDTETRHRQVRVTRGDWVADVDELLAPLIRGLWSAGIETVMSCQDFVDGGRPGFAVVGFARIEDAQSVKARVGGELAKLEYESDDVKTAVAEQYTGTAPAAFVFWPTKYFANRGASTIRPNAKKAKKRNRR